jgi:NAD(P)-dependent dehydrogenase (short-subunit alcohol dehydrogenase family)
MKNRRLLHMLRGPGTGHNTSMSSTHPKKFFAPRVPRVCFVTGGTGGIGRAVALQLARGGDRVIFTGRDTARGAATLAALRETGPGLDHVFVPADLSLLSETARLAERVDALTSRLDAAVFCAGILSTLPELTTENLERNFVLNYLSRYLLVKRLLPKLRAAASGRVTIVSNAGVYEDTLDFEDLQHRRGKPGLHVAGRTQFANDLLATELAAQIAGSGVEVTCVAPGTFIDTDVFRNARGLPAALRFVLRMVQRLLRRSPEWAAQTPVYLAQDQTAVGTNGRFFGPNRKELKVPERALRRDRREALWRASEKLVEAYLPEVRVSEPQAVAITAHSRP